MTEYFVSQKAQCEMNKAMYQTLQTRKLRVTKNVFEELSVP